MESLLLVPVVVGVLIFLTIFGWIVIKARYKKVGPDEALIIYGSKKMFGKKVRDDAGDITGLRIIRGGGAFIKPLFESWEVVVFASESDEAELPAKVAK